MYDAMLTTLAAGNFFTDNAGLIVALAIVVIGLFVIGLKDVLRLSPVRIWAVSSVGFTEAIRRKVLWVTPLAILGVILVAQFQRPIDELDAIRQTTKFCLFATGMLVTLTAILLACTNLPKEIDNRVIFTIVTKPTTRLEIVLGKVVGFARVSATILLIMGVFTFSYLHLRAWTMQRDVKQRLESPTAVEVALRPTLEHYIQAGLLNAKEYFQPSDLSFYSSIPENESARRWISGVGEQQVAIPFEIPADKIPATVEQAAELLGPMSLRIVGKVDVRRSKGAPEAEAVAEPTTKASTAPEGFEVRVPYLPGKEPVGGEEDLTGELAASLPYVGIDILDRDFYNLAEPQQVNGGAPVEMKVGDNQTFNVQVDNAALPLIARQAFEGNPARLFVNVRGLGQGYEFSVDPASIRLGYAPPSTTEVVFAEEYPSVKSEAGTIRAAYRGRMGNHGLQLRGDTAGQAPVAIMSYRGQPFDADGRTHVPVEVRTFIERSGADETEESLLDLAISVRNADTNETSEAVVIHPDNGRTAYANVPAAALAGGNFDLLLQVNTPGAWISLNGMNVGMVSADRSFGLNLFKSLFVLWLLSILVVTIAVFCSTFLSWPIAVVLTVLILLGRWGVMQLGDSLTPGIGRQVVTDFRLQGSAESAVVSNTVENLATALRTFSKVLPDIDRFAVTTHIERGVWIPGAVLWDALIVLLFFGVPLVVLAYVIFRNKEVAP